MILTKELFYRVLTAFLAIYQSDKSRFDARDVERVTKNSWNIERFALTSETEGETLKGLVKCMEWRNSLGVNDLNENSFPRELHELSI